MVLSGWIICMDRSAERVSCTGNFDLIDQAMRDTQYVLVDFQLISRGDTRYVLH